MEERGGEKQPWTRRGQRDRSPWKKEIPRREREKKSFFVLPQPETNACRRLDTEKHPTKRKDLKKNYRKAVMDAAILFMGT